MFCPTACDIYIFAIIFFEYHHGICIYDISADRIFDTHNSIRVFAVCVRRQRSVVFSDNFICWSAPPVHRRHCDRCVYCVADRDRCCREPFFHVQIYRFVVFVQIFDSQYLYIVRVFMNRTDAAIVIYVWSAYRTIADRYIRADDNICRLCICYRKIGFFRVSLYCCRILEVIVCRSLKNSLFVLCCVLDNLIQDSIQVSFFSAAPVAFPFLLVVGNHVVITLISCWFGVFKRS